MAEEDLFKKGFSESFEDIFDEDKFNERQKYATFIFWVAVVVEVFASAIGFFFATSTGYNAYDQIPEKERTTSTLIYAIQGSLPFFLVAVIEPLKIPLAGGLYYVRSVGWRILIFMALLGLTVVTFETMLTSFEQNLTNVNGSVIKQNNLIEKINGDLKNLKEEQAELNKDDEDGVTLKIKKLNDDLNQQRKDELNKLEEKLKSNISPLQKSKDQNLIKLSSLTTDINTADKLKIDNLKDQLREQEQNREKIIQKAANDIEKYLQTIQGASNLKSQEKDKKISDYKQEIKSKKSERDDLQNKIISIKGELAKKLNKIEEDEKNIIKNLEEEEK